jgi:glycosyltransferase involved in cell wall biosynthesis
MAFRARHELPVEAASTCANEIGSRMSRPDPTIDSLPGRAYHHDTGREKGVQAFLPFTIVIPTRNRPASLERCLAALERLDYPRNSFEVVVVDDGSTASLDAAIARARGTMDVRLLSTTHAGPAAARNAGAAIAQNRFLAFTDDDCLPSAGWLSALARELERDPNALVGGSTLNALAQNRFSAASQDLVSYLYDYYNHAKPRFFCSNNLALAKEAFHAIQGFNPRFPFAAGEDRDLCDRWAFEQRPARYAADAVVLHGHDLNLKTFWVQHLRYGRAAAHFRALFALRRGQRVSIEPLAFYIDLLRYPFTRSSGGDAWTGSALLLFSQVANMSGFFYETMLRYLGRSEPIRAQARASSPDKPEV